VRAIAEARVAERSSLPYFSFTFSSLCRFVDNFSRAANVRQKREQCVSREHLLGSDLFIWNSSTRDRLAGMQAEPI
jgi:hypothetical protein